MGLLRDCSVASVTQVGAVVHNVAIGLKSGFVVRYCTLVSMVVVILTYVQGAQTWFHFSNLTITLTPTARLGC